MILLNWCRYGESNCFCGGNKLQRIAIFRGDFFCDFSLLLVFVDLLMRGVLARGRVTSTSYELTRIRYNWWELGTKMANFVLSCQIVLIPYLIPRFSHNHQEIFTIVPYSTLIPEAIFHQEGYCRNCTVFHLVFPRLTHIFLYIFIVKYIHNILSLIPY